MVLIVINVIVLVLLIFVSGYLVFTRNKNNINVNDIIKNQEDWYERLLKEQNQKFEDVGKQVNSSFSNQDKLINAYNEKVVTEVKSITDMQKERLSVLDQSLDKLIKSNESRMDKISSLVEGRLDKILANNDQKLEDMRKTVDEKLNEGLERRFKESFKLMNNQFDQVSVKLGEMKRIADSVGDLQRVLKNVKTRGTFGEVQLSNLLSQMLSNEQFKQNVQVKENSAQRVDFAIVLPENSAGGETYLPIDSKFPVEDYINLLDASDKGNDSQVDKLRKNIERTVKKQAKSISEKYINPPKTTSFAIMYVAIEGLYSEILRNPSLIATLQNKYRIILSGPTTFSAILNSLQLGFKTLTIQKHSKEIWDALEGFRTEFTKFTDLLTRTQKKVGEVSDTIDDATKRTKIIQRRLDNVSTITMNNNQKLLDKNKDDE